MAQCYRHPSRETNVSCSSCGKPICPSCMTPTSVGMRCPDCAGDRTPVRTAASIRSSSTNIPATITLIAINVIAFLASGQFGLSASGASGNTIYYSGALFGPHLFAEGHIYTGVADGGYWRLVTGGFLHAGFFHIAFNMYLLWFLGRILEPAIGAPRFLAVYFTSLLGGSAGALLLDPAVVTVGASGAIFGVAGAVAVVMHRRGMNPWEAGIGGLIVINLILGFVIPGISVGGHIGGLIAGSLGMLAIHEADRFRQPVLGFAACAAIAALAVVGGIAAAGQTVGLFG